MLRFTVRNKPRRLSKAGPVGGPQARIDKMRKLVTALIRHERIEGMYPYMHETRGYAERLIQIAAKHGDNHEPTMKLADYWLLEKDLIHKLFKVVVPRYQKLNSTITQFHRLPDSKTIEMACLELKGNPWPPVVPKERIVGGSLVNVLLNEAKKDYRKNKYKAMEAEISGSISDLKISAESDSSNKDVETGETETDILENNQSEINKSKT